MPNNQPEYVMSQSGKKKAVILPIREYERLMEDLHDLAVIAERREEPVISLSELEQHLKDHARI